MKVNVLVGAQSRQFLSAIFKSFSDHIVVALAANAEAAKSMSGVDVLSVQEFEPDHGWFTEKHTLTNSDDVASISFSSGTTGTPKKIVLSHRALADVITRLNDVMQVDDTIREYVGVPVNFSFGFGRIRAVATAGGASYLPEHGFNPLEISQMLKNGEINAISAVPTLWRVLLQNKAIFDTETEAVKWIEIGSQYMSRSEKEQLKELFPNAKIVQHYGLTEASRSTFLDISATSGPALESVGRVLGQTQMQISPEGKIMLKGPHLCDGLLQGEAYASVTDEQGWLTTEDLGRIEEGYLYFEGRSDDLINCGGLKLSPEQFENKLLEYLDTDVPAGSIAVGKVDDELRGNLVLVSWLEDHAVDHEALRRAAEKSATHFGLVGASAIAYGTCPAFPKTATGKLQRALLAEKITSFQMTSGVQKTAPTHIDAQSEKEADALRSVWEECLNTSPISIHESFFDLGGDSLSALQVMIRMERMGIPKETTQLIFDGKTIAEIVGIEPDKSEALEQGHSGLKLTDAINAVNATRGILVWLVIAVHWLPGVVERLRLNSEFVLGALTPFFRMGTPGFAMVFGIGLGALRVPQYLDNRPRYWQTMRRNLLIVFIGGLLLALFTFIEKSMNGQMDDPLLLTAMFYNIIIFYVMMIATEGLYIALAARNKHIVTNFVGLAAVAFAVGALTIYLFEGPSTSGIADVARLFVTSNYNYFKLAGCVLVGAAIGYHFRVNFQQSQTLYHYIVAGLAAIIFGMTVTLQIAPFENLLTLQTAQLWHITVYTGFIFCILTYFCQLNNSAKKAPLMPIRFVNCFLIVSGLMALPLYIGHALAFKGVHILEVLGISNGLAILISIGTFVVLSAYIYRRIWRIYFRQ